MDIKKLKKWYEGMRDKILLDQKEEINTLELNALTQFDAILQSIEYNKKLDTLNAHMETIAAAL
jgi:hypothetical protein